MTTVHVIGAAGYAGAQLTALVDAHPHFTLGQVTARADAGKRIVDVAPEYRVDALLQELDLDGVAAGDFAAVCYPHAEAAAVVSELVDRGVRVVDVSADHRLTDPSAYPHWYGFDHPRPDLLAEAGITWLGDFVVDDLPARVATRHGDILSLPYSVLSKHPVG